MGLKPGTNPDVEAVMIELSIDGKSVTAKSGVSLYDVISSTGKIIPAMCYHYTFDPFGSCGMCLVMQEGKKAPVRSCTAKAAAGMIVKTDGDDLFLARKKAVEKHLSVHPLDCPVCDADGHCELQDMAFRHGVTNLANAKQKFIPEDTRSPVLDFNMNRCIACAECINVCKDVLMIDALQFMKKGGFNQVVPKGDLALSCEFCGDCLAVCPVGAITNKFSKYLYKPWQMKKTTTTCNYCGDGCQMYLETKDAEVVRVTSPLSWKNKWGDRAETAKGHGGICVRGRFGFEYIDSAARLKQPLLRKGNQLVEAPWLETMHHVVIMKSFTYIAVPISSIINYSFSAGIFLNQLKIAKICPIVKNGETNLLQNFRPIFVLPSFLKIYEKVILSRILKYLSTKIIFICFWQY